MNSFQFRSRLSLVIILTFLPFLSLSWGFYGHRLINGKAIYALPEEMFSFYKRNADYLTEHSVDPDKRRYSVKEEAPRHYIDLDHYVHQDEKGIQEGTIDSLELQNWKEAIRNYGEDSLNEYGVLPWHLNLMVHRLEDAFKSGNGKEILRISAEIGHYAADAHVPLHTTENYNGQLTGQKGIHALWESRIPERKGDGYTFLSGKAVYLEKVQSEIWKTILESHKEVPFVLQSEKTLRSVFPPDRVYRPSTVGRKVSPQFTSAYVEAYSESNNTLVESRMKRASYFIACLWYTAWINAGQPDLSQIASVNMNSESEKGKKESDHER